MVEDLRYKLRYLGVTLDGPTEVFCDNKSFVNNSSIPTSVSNKRPNTLFYHSIREVQSGSVLRIGWILGEFNLEYFLTKTSMPWHTRHNLVDSILSKTASPIGGIDTA